MLRMQNVISERGSAAQQTARGASAGAGPGRGSGAGRLPGHSSSAATQRWMKPAGFLTNCALCL